MKIMAVCGHGLGSSSPGGLGGADRHGLPVLPRGQGVASASPGAGQRACQRHRADQPVHRPTGARHQQSPHARAGADERASTALPAGGRGIDAFTGDHRSAG